VRSIAPRSALLIRLAEILDAGTIVTYTRIKSTLVREFGPSNFERHRKAISAELAAKSAGNAMTMEYRGWDVKRELAAVLQEAVEARYRGIHTLCAPDTEFFASDVVQLVKVCRSLRKDLSNLWQHFQTPYALVSGGFSIYDEMLSWYVAMLCNGSLGHFITTWAVLLLPPVPCHDLGPCLLPLRRLPRPGLCYCPAPRL